MLLTYRYRLYPNCTKRVMLNKHFGCVRWVWNWALEKKVEAYEQEEKRLSRYDLQKHLPDMKRDPDTEWLGEVNSQSLQEALVRLEKAFTAFFKADRGFPRFKAKKWRGSFTCPQNVKVDFDAGKVRLPKIGWMRAKLSRGFEGQIKTCVVVKEPTGKVFISVVVEDDLSPPAKAPVQEDTAVGVDLGIKDFAALSNGKKVPNPKHLEKALGRLKVLQKRLARKKRGSARREKARLRVARQHEKVRNQRRDFLHKLSTYLVEEFNTICLETLNVSGMVKNRCLARHISGAGWSTFVGMIEYKAERKGVNVLRIGPFEPSSKTCTCGHINSGLGLSNRRWQCPECAQEHDRDLLAASNIKRFALAETHLSSKSGSGRSEALAESSAMAEA